jgi:phosphoribosylglycinamide formyltransferase 1
MFRVAVCISGNGSLVPALIEAAPGIPVEITRVVADRPDAPGLSSSWAKAVNTVCIDRRQFTGPSPAEQLSDAVLEAVRSQADIVVLAGFLSILKGSILEVYKGRILNIHPALLPKFGGKGMYGMHVHRAVLASDEKESGCTVHQVTGGIDSGPIVLQSRVPISADETPHSLQHKVRQTEGPTLIAALGKLVSVLQDGIQGGG